MWVIDPAFAQAFQVVSPTPRYAFLLSAVPALLVAPLPRVLRAVLLLGAELARCFEAKDLPLPPWRHADALATRYDTATSAEVRPDGVAVPAPSAASFAAPSAAARKQQRDAEQRERVQLRLLKLGVPASAIAAAGAELSEPRSPPTPEAAAGRQPASSRSSLDEAIDSPRSVVQVCAAGCRGGCASGCVADGAAVQALGEPVAAGGRRVPAMVLAGATVQYHHHSPCSSTVLHLLCRRRSGAPCRAPSPPVAPPTSAFVGARQAKPASGKRGASGSPASSGSQRPAPPALRERPAAAPARRQVGWPGAAFGPAA